jgi:vitamin B12/bleomycin/antimicrobial peptide transport system ATP-binding/permease protein
MTKQERMPNDRRAWESFLLGIKQFATSGQAGRRARWLFALLFFFLLGLNGLNVVGSYVARGFMTAIEYRNMSEFVRMSFFYIGVFAATTVFSTIYTFTEQRLGLVWREWATRQSVIGYANHRVYFRLKRQGEVGNPDQRIADDIRTFSVTTLSFVLMLSNGILTVIAFSGVMWSISPQLFVVAVLYAAGGTLVTFLFGRPLVRLNYDQLDKEANFRASLIYLRGNAESVALSRREGHLVQLSLNNLRDLASNFRRIISINRNVNFFTTGYNSMIQIIPALIVAPMFIHGKVEFGVITQSAIAFTQLLGAFSLIVTQFQSISSYTATSARLASLMEASERERTALLSNTLFSRDQDRIVFQNLSLCSPRSGRLLLKDLSVEIPKGRRVLVRGHDETARSALFHAVAGLWDACEGRIVRPPLEQVLLVPELPYLPPGTVRELLMGPWPEEEAGLDEVFKTIQVPEERIREMLGTLKIESLLAGFGGLDTRHHWENTLPLDEQQLLVIARVLLSRPQFVFLDRLSTTLQPDRIDWVLGLLTDRSISYVVFENGEDGVKLENFDALLKIEEGGAWTCKPIREGKADESTSPAA